MFNRNNVRNTVTSAFVLVVGIGAIACGSAQEPRTETPGDKLVAATQSALAEAKRNDDARVIMSEADIESLLAPVFKANDALRAELDHEDELDQQTREHEREMLYQSMLGANELVKTLHLPVSTPPVASSYAATCQVAADDAAVATVASANEDPRKAKIACYAGAYIVYGACVLGCACIKDPLASAACQAACSVALTAATNACAKITNL